MKPIIIFKVQLGGIKKPAILKRIAVLKYSFF